MNTDTVVMSQPSTAALRLAEELIDHVSYGLTRGEHINEVATMIDDSCGDLVRAAVRIASASDGPHGAPSIEDLRELRRALGAHLPASDHGRVV